MFLTSENFANGIFGLGILLNLVMPRFNDLIKIYFRSRNVSLTQNKFHNTWIAIRKSCIEPFIIHKISLPKLTKFRISLFDLDGCSCSFSTRSVLFYFCICHFKIRNSSSLVLYFSSITSTQIESQKRWKITMINWTKENWMRASLYRYNINSAEKQNCRIFYGLKI